MRIGFIGLGMMGHHMVANLQKAGHELVVYDVRREAGAEALSRGARWAETPADAARQSEIVMTSLPSISYVECTRTENTMSKPVDNKPMPFPLLGEG